eukprot:CAMPEP_0177569646 /NCGR_PEP_ID=MMETSP0369-20130122/76401_1 /TAXON_ID=447022 ORGANISM="Scrippsiella hangoei-like, Strain SHHI-4" /NCGR_SAMPLE_ID=MMETSP0369 /ASSEMBLY_ACC=CAM_ASM_000364 /LENGTH=45 /DNA_ID= /DNA_START= /DNA_END= /DNA_ORIENTATION=
MTLGLCGAIADGEGTNETPTKQAETTPAATILALADMIDNVVRGN